MNLSAAQVFEIREALSSGAKQKELANMYGVTQSLISQIKTGMIYSKIENKRRLSILINPEIISGLKEISNRYDMKFNDYVKMILRQVYEREKKSLNL